MRVLLVSIALLLCLLHNVRAFEENTMEDDDFAEFEQFDTDDDTPLNSLYCLC